MSEGCVACTVEDMGRNGTIVDGGTLRFERELPGPIARVWAHLTRRQLLRRWIGDVVIESAVGGRVEVRLKDSARNAIATAGQHVVRGTVTDWRPPYRFVCRLQDTHDEVRIELRAVGEKVLLVLLHRRLPARTRRRGLRAPALLIARGTSIRSR